MNAADRKLLEEAAKAAGIKTHLHKESNSLWIDGPRTWNPLTEDGDAFRLMVKLNIDVVHAFGTRTAVAENTSGYAAEGQDPYKSTRRAIVHAAADIGKEMK
jgi:hypothetical protein